MKILVINCGSSTIKYQLINMENDEVIAKGRCDMIGYDASNMIYNNVRDGIKDNFDVAMPTHKEGMKVLLDTLLDENKGVLKSLDEIYAVGHRVVHGGDKFSTAVLVNDEVIKEISDLSELAPLHNPGAVMGIEAIRDVAPNLSNVVVFDTACGDIDATAVTKIMEKENLTPAEMERILNKESGRFGLSTIGDQRELINAANSGNKVAMLTRKIQCNRTRKYIGAYMAELNRVDAIVFTGGVAENNFCERLYTVQDMECLGVVIDRDLNFNGSGKESKISTEDSKIPVYVIPTNEELEIAKQTLDVVSQC